MSISSECLTLQSNACQLKFEEYLKIFEIIEEEYSLYCMYWNENFKKCINLKTKYIRDIFNADLGLDDEFREYMNSFISGLDRIYFKIVIRIKSECNLDIRARVKDMQSIINKLNKKSFEQGGRIQVIKCLNDLLGIRVIDKNYKENIDKIVTYLDVCSEYKTRHMERIVDGYKAYHVYFRQSKNIYFPIELQIWDSENEQSNLNSHTLYKQEYIGWGEKYQDIEKRR